MMEKKKRLSHGKIVHYIINALLVLGTLTVLFPLYMTVIIAFKKPSEMTNDISGALSLPSSWNLDCCFMYLITFSCRICDRKKNGKTQDF